MVKRDNNDNIKITNIEQNEPRTPETDEEIERYNKIQAQAQAIVNGDNPLNLSDEQLEEMGVSPEMLAKQMEFYKKQQEMAQANQILGQIFASLIEEDKDSVPDMAIYDELLEHMCSIINKKFNEAYEKAFEECKKEMKSILYDETHGSPLVPFEERLESHAEPIEKEFFSNEDDCEFIPLNSMLKEQLQGAELENTLPAFRLIEFAIQTNLLDLTEGEAAELMMLIANHDMQQSIMLCKTTQEIIDKTLDSMPDLKMEEAAKAVIESLFEINGTTQEAQSTEEE